MWDYYGYENFFLEKCFWGRFKEGEIIYCFYDFISHDL